MDPQGYADAGSSSTPIPATSTEPQQQQPAAQEGVSMVKLTEVFMTAALSFQRLGEITQQIGSTTGDTKWTQKDAEQLEKALTKFQEECSEISKNIQNRTGKMIRTDFKRRTINTYNQQQATNQQNAVASASYAASPSHYNGASPSAHQSYSYQPQRTIPVYPVQQKVAMPSASYTLGQKRPALPLTGMPVKRIVGSTSFRPVSTTNLLPQAYRK